MLDIAVILSAREGYLYFRRGLDRDVLSDSMSPGRYPASSCLSIRLHKGTPLGHVHYTAITKACRPGYHIL